MNDYETAEIKRIDALENKKLEYARWYTPEEIEQHLELEIKLKINSRSANCLRRAGIRSIVQLKEFYQRHGKIGIGLLRNVGPKTVNNIIKRMEDYGIDLTDTKKPDRCSTCGQLIYKTAYENYQDLYDEIIEKGTSYAFKG